MRKRRRCVAAATLADAETLTARTASSSSSLTKNGPTLLVLCATLCVEHWNTIITQLNKNQTVQNNIALISE